MTDAPALTVRAPRRSMGLKLLRVCALALLMTIPALFVFALLADRSNRAEQVGREIGELVGGQQTFLGPVLVLPYTAPGGGAPPPPPPGQDITTATARPGDRVSGVYVIFPTTGQASVGTTSEVRRRSLFSVPVYEADLVFRSRFDLTAFPVNAPAGAVFDWSRAELLVGASDARGAQSDVVVTMAGRRSVLTPAATMTELGLPEMRHEAGPRTAGPATLRFFGTGVADLARPGEVFDVDASLKFSGAQRVAVLPFAKTTTIDVRGEWPHPSFDGGFLPTSRRVTGDGFTARWAVPFIARGVPAEGSLDVLSRLGQSAVGVTFVEPGNPYQSVGRSLKYALLFVGLVFLTYFVFETTTGKRVHPAQYVLVGLTQVIFYLLLLALAEHLGFDIGFAIAATATVALISAYAAWAFDSRREGLRALAVFTVLYAGIYVLMRLEDYALLVGAVASFLAVAAVMWFTRRIDWYGLTDPAYVARQPPAAPGAS